MPYTQYTKGILYKTTKVYNIYKNVRKDQSEDHAKGDEEKLVTAAKNRTITIPAGLIKK